MLQNDERFQLLPKDWKRAAIAHKSILELEQNGKEYDLYLFNQAIWKRCLHAMELYALCQDTHEQGHQSWSTTALQLKRDYYAPHLMEITKLIVSGCDMCKRYALRMKKLVELLSQFRCLHPFAQVSMDFIGPLDQTRSGNRYILLLVDHNTHLDVAVPLPDSSAERVGIILLKELFYKFGLPNILGFDKAWYWITEMLKNAYERLQIFKKTSSSYHPQNSGLVENTNSTLMRMLKKMHNRCEDWDILLDEVLFFYNTTPKKSFKGLSPFEWLYGFSPRFMNQKMKKIISEFMTEEAFDRCVETRQDLLLRTPELVQDVIVEKAKVVEQLNENQDRLPSRALFHKDDLVFLEKYPALECCQDQV